MPLFRLGLLEVGCFSSLDMSEGDIPIPMLANFAHNRDQFISCRQPDTILLTSARSSHDRAEKNHPSRLMFEFCGEVAKTRSRRTAQNSGQVGTWKTQSGWKRGQSARHRASLHSADFRLFEETFQSPSTSEKTRHGNHQFFHPRSWEIRHDDIMGSNVVTNSTASTPVVCNHYGNPHT